MFLKACLKPYHKVFMPKDSENYLFFLKDMMIFIICFIWISHENHEKFSVFRLKRRISLVFSLWSILEITENSPFFPIFLRFISPFLFCDSPFLFLSQRFLTIKGVTMSGLRFLHMISHLSNSATQIPNLFSEWV